MLKITMRYNELNVTFYVDQDILSTLIPAIPKSEETQFINDVCLFMADRLVKNYEQNDNANVFYLRRVLLNKGENTTHSIFYTNGVETHSKYAININDLNNEKIKAARASITVSALSNVATLSLEDLAKIQHLQNKSMGLFEAYITSAREMLRQNFRDGIIPAIPTPPAPNADTFLLDYFFDPEIASEIFGLAKEIEATTEDTNTLNALRGSNQDDPVLKDLHKKSQINLAMDKQNAKRKKAKKATIHSEEPVTAEIKTSDTTSMENVTSNIAEKSEQERTEKNKKKKFKKKNNKIPSSDALQEPQPMPAPKPKEVMSGIEHIVLQLNEKAEKAIEKFKQTISAEINAQIEKRNALLNVAESNEFEVAELKHYIQNRIDSAPTAKMLADVKKTEENEVKRIRNLWADFARYTYDTGYREYTAIKNDLKLIRHLFAWTVHLAANKYYEQIKLEAREEAAVTNKNKTDAGRPIDKKTGKIIPKSETEKFYLDQKLKTFNLKFAGVGIKIDEIGFITPIEEVYDFFDELAEQNPNKELSLTDLRKLLNNDVEPYGLLQLCNTSTYTPSSSTAQTKIIDAFDTFATEFQNQIGIKYGNNQDIFTRSYFPPRKNHDVPVEASANSSVWTWSYDMAANAVGVVTRLYQDPLGKTNFAWTDAAYSVEKAIATAAQKKAESVNTLFAQITTEMENPTIPEQDNIKENQEKISHLSYLANIPKVLEEIEKETEELATSISHHTELLKYKKTGEKALEIAEVKKKEIEGNIQKIKEIRAGISTPNTASSAQIQEKADELAQSSFLTFKSLESITINLQKSVSDAMQTASKPKTASPKADGIHSTPQLTQSATQRFENRKQEITPEKLETQLNTMKALIETNTDLISYCEKALTADTSVAVLSAEIEKINLHCKPEDRMEYERVMTDTPYDSDKIKRIKSTIKTAVDFFNQEKSHLGNILKKFDAEITDFLAELKLPTPDKAKLAEFIGTIESARETISEIKGNMTEAKKVVRDSIATLKETYTQEEKDRAAIDLCMDLVARLKEVDYWKKQLWAAGYLGGGESCEVDGKKSKVPKGIFAMLSSVAESQTTASNWINDGNSARRLLKQFKQATQDAQKRSNQGCANVYFFGVRNGGTTGAFYDVIESINLDDIPSGGLAGLTTQQSQQNVLKKKIDIVKTMPAVSVEDLKKSAAFKNPGVIASTPPIPAAAADQTEGQTFEMRASRRG